PGSRNVVTAGGRVCSVVGRGRDVAEARERVYAALATIGFEGLYARTDIGAETAPRIWAPAARPPEPAPAPRARAAGPPLPPAPASVPAVAVPAAPLVAAGGPPPAGAARVGLVSGGPDDRPLAELVQSVCAAGGAECESWVAAPYQAPEQV